MILYIRTLHQTQIAVIVDSKGKMVIAIAIAAVLSIQLLSVHSDTVEKCIEGNHHKKVPSAEPSGFVTCFPWQNRSCCSPEVTVELKEYGGKHMYHIDWDHCGGLSEV